jgi:hypothetical protein
MGVFVKFVDSDHSLLENGYLRRWYSAAAAVRRGTNA